MRALWLIPTQLPVVMGGPPTGLGWIEGLRAALADHAPEVSLVIAAWGDVKHSPFSEGNAEYWSIGSREPSTRHDRLLRRWRHAVIPEGAVADCERIAQEVSPDIIHVHGSETFLGLTLERAPFPGVISLQGIATAYLDHWFTGLTGRDLMTLLGDRSHLHGYGLFHDYARERARIDFERRVFGSCDDYLGRTAWDRTVLMSMKPSARYHEVNEVLGDRFYEEVWGEPPAPENIIFSTSGSRPVKGVETLLEAIALLRDSSGVDVRLRVAGGVENGPLWPVLRRRLKDRRLAGTVELLGVLQPAEIVRELKRASLFVHPSHIDNSPNALCEALLMGTPCVASYVGGVPSLICDEDTGLLYHDRDPYMLAGAIRRLLADRSLAARLGRAARQTALARHDRGAIARALVFAYERVLASWSSVGGTR